MTNPQSQSQKPDEQQLAENKGCLGFILSLLVDSEPADDGPPPYQANQYLMSKAEHSFYGVLLQAKPVDSTVFAKVRLADLLHVKRGTEKRQKWFNKISAKHVDFVICETKSLAPRLVIELDDSSHQRSDRQQRDTFLDRALAAAGMPLLRVPAKRGYNVEELQRSIVEKLMAPRS